MDHRAVGESGMTGLTRRPEEKEEREKREEREREKGGEEECPDAGMMLVHAGSHTNHLQNGILGHHLRIITGIIPLWM